MYLRGICGLQASRNALQRCLWHEVRRRRTAVEGKRYNLVQTQRCWRIHKAKKGGLQASLCGRASGTSSSQRFPGLACRTSPTHHADSDGATTTTTTPRHHDTTTKQKKSGPPAEETGRQERHHTALSRQLDPRNANDTSSQVALFSALLLRRALCCCIHLARPPSLSPLAFPLLDEPRPSSRLQVDAHRQDDNNNARPHPALFAYNRTKRKARASRSGRPALAA